MDDQVVGVLGGGQLGRMMVQAASKIGMPVITLDAQNSPASQVLNPQAAYPASSPNLKHHIGSFNNPDDIQEFSKSVDVLTVEIEHVNVDTLEKMQSNPTGGRSKKGIKVYPSPSVIKIIQDKFRQKHHLHLNGVPVAHFEEIPESESLVEIEKEVHRVGDRLGFPLMLKSRLFAYDGRGNFLVREPAQISEAVRALSPPPSNGSPNALKLYAEKFIPFICEIAVMVVRSKAPESEAGSSGSSYSVRTYPPVETNHQNNICHIVRSPLRKGGPKAHAAAVEMAQRAIDALGDGAVGVFGVEMFLLPDGTVLLNEIAPRPHNSYHHTIASTPISQFTAHLLAISSKPLPSPQSFELAVPSTAMINILGHKDGKDGERQIKDCIRLASQLPGTSIELYGKSGCRKGRKMGHVNVVGQSDAEVDLITQQVVATLPSSSQCKTLEELENLPKASSPGFSHPNPLVSIIMGSDSDLPTMIEASRILSNPRFNIPHELTIVSAHRTPDRMIEFAHSAASRGVKVIIAGAGGAAHLPGMVSALTPLPVIGVPVKGKVLDGVDSLHSIVQMPRGIPVATVAIGNSTNAALLAIRMLSISNPRLLESMSAYMKQMENEVLGKIVKLEQVGWVNY